MIELLTLTDKWTFFIKNAETLKMIPSFVDEEGLMTAFQEADKHNWKKEELIAYDNASIRIQDARGEKELAHEQGLEQGIEQGENNIIIEMYKEGLSIENIVKFTKVSIERVQHIINYYEKNKKT